MPHPGSRTVTTLEARIQRLEDRAAIVDVVISYATAIDRRDWNTWSSLFTDQVHVDFSEAGMPAADFPREQFVGFARQGLDIWPATQHLSPNHQVVINGDEAVCYSAMYAQHHTEQGDYVMRGSYDNHLVRTAGGWKIARLVQHLSWLEGDPRTAASS
nr:nuclear transport factor 2 family protein [Kineosporia mesophila]